MCKLPVPFTQLNETDLCENKNCTPVLRPQPVFVTENGRNVFLAIITAAVFLHPPAP